MKWVKLEIGMVWCPWTMNFFASEKQNFAGKHVRQGVIGESERACDGHRIDLE